MSYILVQLEMRILTFLKQGFSYQQYMGTLCCTESLDSDTLTTLVDESYDREEIPTPFVF